MQIRMIHILYYNMTSVHILIILFNYRDYIIVSLSLLYNKLVDNTRLYMTPIFTIITSKGPKFIITFS